MGERIVVGLFIAAFFAALPLWGLAQQDGWIDVSGARVDAAGPFLVQVVKRQAFSRERASITVVGAHTTRVDAPTRMHRHGAGAVLLVLETPQGPWKLLRREVGTAQALDKDWRAVEALAQQVTDARDQGRTSFAFTVAPGLGFWLMLGLVVLFAGVGFSIAWFGGR